MVLPPRQIAAVASLVLLACVAACADPKPPATPSPSATTAAPEPAPARAIPGPSAEKVELAKSVVEAHIAIVGSLPDPGTAESRTTIENLGRVEASVWKLLSPEEAAQVRAYSDAQVAGRADVKAKVLAVAQPASQPAVAGAERVGGPCQCFGFIICYQECCSNGAGNGVCACVGGMECDSCWSDSCPP
jgi:hypothetical protein